MADTLRDVPEFFENELGESLSVRTESLAAFRDLGPPDLCHVTKVNVANKSASRETGSYHNVLGVDASSSASLAAYINSLTYSVDDTQGWFSKSSTWKIRSGIFCCYNAFSHVDVRVEVKIPGGVDCYIVTPRGERLEPTPQIWQECHVSAMLRAVLYSEESGYRLHALRRVYPITSLSMENKFLESCSALYWNGWQLGSNSEVQMTTTVRNHLNDGLMKYFEDCGRFDTAAEFFKALYARDAEVGALLANCYFGANQEVKGVQILHEALQKHPASYPLLHSQADFLKRKKRYNSAIQLAKFAVKTAPSEFLAWAKLTEMYIESDQFELALLTLNSCPMFTFTDKDYPRMPQSAKIHLPTKMDLSAVMDLSDYEPKTVDPSESYLLRLPAPSLRGTFAKAYAFLAQLVKKVGWDELLRLRSSVFVMEDEYRQQKAREEAVPPPAAPTNHGGPTSTDPQADSEAVPSQSNPAPASPSGGFTSDLDRRLEDLALDDDRPLGNGNGTIVMESATRPTDLAEAFPEKQPPLATAATHRDPIGSIHHKRLCERWLDNLFMVLYEDLRAYIDSMSEIYRSQANPQSTFRHTAAEWEALGDLAWRLLYKAESKEAYIHSVQQRFSPKPWLQLLTLYTEEGNLQMALNAVVQLSIYQERWYNEMVYPSATAAHVATLIREHGLSKIHNVLISMNLAPPLHRLVTRYFAFAQAFQMEGTEW
ncbi:putative Bud site selection-related protein [Dimargaris cristalligena]|uniref:Putative Bud site selection-related protein n=1 Tax=Dimargaris cristalligena TaxID=215637 RepID=A0A4Q0A204_9FUNG|nr:putative Bud site selection-related protein [Dimargaris cristalligena]|eukprot:RKP40094.1 putative Bud site selection-related protein [Dimargaris cristalligena]